jgi:FixJ family two-component response regulator
LIGQSEDPQMPEEIYYHAFLNRDRLIHVVDPELQTCEALSVLFRLEGFQTAFSINLPGFLASLDRRRPDVVIANIDLSDPEEGLVLLRRVKMLRMGTPVFMVENRPMVDAAVAAMKAGAADVVTKPIDNENLVRVVREAMRQDIHVTAASAGRRSVEVRGFAQLTPREREVLQLITDGQSNKEAGRELGISPRTIEVHRARVMEKLGARNTADLMRIVLTS